MGKGIFGLIQIYPKHTRRNKGSRGRGKVFMIVCKERKGE